MTTIKHKSTKRASAYKPPHLKKPNKWIIISHSFHQSQIDNQTDVLLKLTTEWFKIDINCSTSEECKESQTRCQNMLKGHKNKVMVMKCDTLTKRNRTSLYDIVKGLKRWYNIQLILLDWVLDATAIDASNSERLAYDMLFANDETAGEPSMDLIHDTVIAINDLRVSFCPIDFKDYEIINFRILLQPNIDNIHFSNTFKILNWFHQKFPETMPTPPVLAETKRFTMALDNATNFKDFRYVTRGRKLLEEQEIPYMLSLLSGDVSGTGEDCKNVKFIIFAVSTIGTGKQFVYETLEAVFKDQVTVVPFLNSAPKIHKSLAEAFRNSNILIYNANNHNKKSRSHIKTAIARLKNEFDLRITVLDFINDTDVHCKEFHYECANQLVANDILKDTRSNKSKILRGFVQLSQTEFEMLTLGIDTFDYLQPEEFDGDVLVIPLSFTKQRIVEYTTTILTTLKERFSELELDLDKSLAVVRKFARKFDLVEKRSWFHYVCGNDLKSRKFDLLQIPRKFTQHPLPHAQIHWKIQKRPHLPQVDSGIEGIRHHLGTEEQEDTNSSFQDPTNVSRFFPMIPFRAAKKLSVRNEDFFKTVNFNNDTNPKSTEASGTAVKEHSEEKSRAFNAKKLLPPIHSTPQKTNDHSKSHTILDLFDPLNSQSRGSSAGTVLMFTPATANLDAKTKDKSVFSVPDSQDKVTMFDQFLGYIKDPINQYKRRNHQVTKTPNPKAKAKSNTTTVQSPWVLRLTGIVIGISMIMDLQASEFWRSTTFSTMTQQLYETSTIFNNST